MSNYIGQFRTAMQQHGITPPASIIADGELHRFASDGSRGGNTGWYAFYAGDIPHGTFGCWRLGIKQSWQADIGRALTPEEEAAQKEQIAVLRRKQETEKQIRHAEAKETAHKILAQAQVADDTYPYLVRKHAKAYGVFVYNKKLVVPLHDESGTVHSLQYINTNGDKQFMTGGRVKGCYHLIGEPQDIVCIAEGYATAATIFEATGYPVAVAFNAGNLALVAQTMREKYPAAKIVLCADDDWQTDNNPGLTKAKEAAGVVGGLLALPTFGKERAEKATDFNDMAAASGLDSVKAIIAATLAAGDVTPVTDVTANNTEGLDVTAGAAVDVTDVTGGGANTDNDVFGFFVCDKWTERKGRKLHPGVWRSSGEGSYCSKGGAPDTDPEYEWVCSPLHVKAVTHDQQQKNFGRLLRFLNTNGTWVEWAMPMGLLRGSCEELRGILLDMGLLIDPTNRNLLPYYLQTKPPKRRIRCALQVGWCGESFVLPDKVIGAAAADVVYQSEDHTEEEFTEAGTLEGWKQEISARAQDNPVLMLSLSVAFAGPLLWLCRAESGGLHWVGDSSTGKTSAIEAARSVWGNEKYMRSWKATANGMEAAAGLVNDCLLALDEISEADPREVGRIVYALANGRGKQRANKYGNARSVRRWRCSVLSSGERTIGTTMADGGFVIKAGQSVRLIDVPAMRKSGAWNNLHGFESGAAFSDAIKKAADAHHGKVGRAFLERLTRDKQNFSERLEQIKYLPLFAAKSDGGQEQRVAGRFAVIALAGEVATEYGLTGWPTGAATEAAAEMFAAWRALRGGGGNDERTKILEQVADFIGHYGNSRFDHVGGTDHPCHNRAGWWREENGNRIFLFTAGGLREALQGFDFRRVLTVLQEAGVLPAADGEKAKPKRLAGVVTKVYEIHADKLTEPVTPVTATAAPYVTEKPLQTKDVTPETAVTPPNGKASKFTKPKGGKVAKAEGHKRKT